MSSAPVRLGWLMGATLRATMSLTRWGRGRSSGSRLKCAHTTPTGVSACHHHHQQQETAKGGACRAQLPNQYGGSGEGVGHLDVVDDGVVVGVLGEEHVSVQLVDPVHCHACRAVIIMVGQEAAASQLTEVRGHRR